MGDHTRDFAVKPRPSMPFIRSRTSSLAVCVLAALYAVSVLDRFVLALLVAPIRRDLGLSDLQFGLLTGIAFATAYAIGGIIFGWAIDRFSRRWLIWSGVTLWSLATAACGMAGGFLQLFAARIGLGIGESALQPGANSLLSDLVPRSRLSSTLTRYSMGASVGGFLAFVFGGALINWLNIHSAGLPLLGRLPPWRTVFLIMGPIGLILTQLLFLIPEPPRTGTVGIVNASWRMFFRFVWRIRAFLGPHIGAFTLIFLIIGAVHAWTPAYAARQYGWNPAQVGLLMGGMLLSGIISFWVSGRVCDRMFKRGVKNGPMRWTLICTAVGAPSIVLAYAIGTSSALIVGLFLWHISTMSAPVLGHAAIQLVTPNEYRGRLSALYLLIAYSLGQALGPVLVPTISDLVFADESKLGVALALTCGIAYPVAIVLLCISLGPTRRATLEFERHAAAVSDSVDGLSHPAPATAGVALSD
jgi:MFS family permease